MLSKFLLKEHSALLSFAIKFIDLLIYLSANLFAYYLQFKDLHLNLHYQLATIFSLLLLNPVFSFACVYKSLRGSSIWHYIKPIMLGIILLAFTLSLAAFVSKTGYFYSRFWFITWHIYAFALMLVVRLLLRQLLHIMRKRGLNQKRIIIVGDADIASDLVNRIQAASWTGFFVAKTFASNFDTNSSNRNAQLQYFFDSIENYIIQNDISEVWLAFSSWSKTEGEAFLKKLSKLLITIRYFPNIMGLDFIKQSVSDVLGLSAINILSSPIIGVNKLIKDIEDKVLSVIILLLISPLFLLIAILVKMSSKGPVFFCQDRIGWNGKTFKMLKFRSMPVNAEKNTGAIWATPGDSRVTKIGSFLRKTSLDELPQFINVLKGDMSIVGPRPERPIFVEKFKNEIPAYMQKHLVKAGITGWAQINGWRGATDLEKRIEYDLNYINHWSLEFDLKIIFLTIFKGFINKNAY